MFLNKPEVKIIKEIDTSKLWWCSSAVLFSVKNGKNTISEISGPEDKDYEYVSQLQLNGKPLVQGKYPECPTCKAMLATGYGIENIESPELEAARTCMNSEFVSIMDSAEKIKPLLGLLRDGYYALADTICFPTDGEGNFFYEVPNELKHFDAACSGYYCEWDFGLIEHFPFFLYPSQSSSLINNERVNYYSELLRSEKNPPRALAYHVYGFMNLLLDGHHKACAAASLGKCVRCLTIIPCDGSYFVKDTVLRGVSFEVCNPQIKTLLFAGLKTDAENDLHYHDIYMGPGKTHDVPFRKYSLTDTKIHYGPDKYPTVRDLAVLMDAGDVIEGLLPDLDPDAISRLNYEDTDDADYYLVAILRFIAFVDQDAAYRLASTIVKNGDGPNRHNRVRAALLYLLQFKNDETEQLFADYYLNHDKNDEHDENLAIANSYWKDNKN